jgi:hypothetical protein
LPPTLPPTFAPVVPTLPPTFAPVAPTFPPTFFPTFPPTTPPTFPPTEPRPPSAAIITQPPQQMSGPRPASTLPPGVSFGDFVLGPTSSDVRSDGGAGALPTPAVLTCKFYFYYIIYYYVLRFTFYVTMCEE